MTHIKNLLTSDKCIDEISPFAHNAVTSTTASSYITNAAKLVANLKKGVTNLDDFTPNSPYS